MKGRAVDDLPQRLWQEALAAPHRLLMLDYDGTLAPFRVARHEAVPSPGVVDLLRAIAAGGGTTLAIVSGRPADEVSRLVGPIEATLVGEHGWEARRPGGSLVRHPLTEELALALRQAAEAANSHGWCPRQGSAQTRRGRTRTRARRGGSPAGGGFVWSG